MHQDRVILNCIVGLVGILFFPATAAWGQNSIVLVNQSGEPALVKLSGPTPTDVRVPSGAKLELDAEAGRYFIKIRYGRPGGYRYTRREGFTVLETATARSETVVRLRPISGDTPHSRSISHQEFYDSDTGLPEWQHRVAKGEARFSPWVEIVRDPELQEVWRGAESAYREATALNQIPAGRNQDLIAFENIVRDHAVSPLVRTGLEARFGKPRRVLEEDGIVWLDYGPIQLGLDAGGGEVHSLRAQRGYYTHGFAAVADRAIQRVIKPAQ